MYKYTQFLENDENNNVIIDSKKNFSLVYTNEKEYIITEMDKLNKQLNDVYNDIINNLMIFITI
jgi:hypothetical protein